MKRTPKLKTLPVWMRENGVTISAMAEEMDVSHMTVRRYMAGSVIPTVENMCKIKKITKGEVIADSFYPYCDAA